MLQHVQWSIDQSVTHPTAKNLAGIGQTLQVWLHILGTVQAMHHTYGTRREEMGDGELRDKEI